jgi:hypothetical protein
MMHTFLSFNIEKYIYFTYPFGWEELGVIATVAAVVVALCANRGARKQLKSALEMQEQSKNVALLEQRVHIADLIREDKAPSITAMRVLFDDGICNYYDTLSQARKRCQEAQYDERVFFGASKESDGEGGWTNQIQSKIEEFQYFMSRPDCPESIFENYQKYCNEHTAWWSDSGLSNDRRTYNHAEISKRMADALSEIEETKNKLLIAIEENIANSIAPINKKKIGE